MQDAFGQELNMYDLVLIGHDSIYPAIFCGIGSTGNPLFYYIQEYNFKRAENGKKLWKTWFNSWRIWDDNSGLKCKKCVKITENILNEENLEYYKAIKNYLINDNSGN